MVDASEEDEADSSEEEDNGEAAEVAEDPPIPVKSSKRAMPVAVDPPEKIVGATSPSKKQKGTHPVPLTSPPIKPSPKNKPPEAPPKEKPATSPAPAAKNKQRPIPKVAIPPMSQAQAIQAALSGKKTFTTLAAGNKLKSSKLKLKNTTNADDQELAEAAKKYAETQEELDKSDDVDLEHQHPDVEEDHEEGEVSDGNPIVFATRTVIPCADLALEEGEGKEQEGEGT